MFELVYGLLAQFAINTDTSPAPDTVLTFTDGNDTDTAPLEFTSPDDANTDCVISPGAHLYTDNCTTHTHTHKSRTQMTSQKYC